MEKHDANTSITYGNSLLKHDGIISKISSNTITVALKGNIDCEGCNAKMICGASGSNVKEIEVFDFNESFRLNDNVVVALQKQLGLKAVIWAYIFPFILMLSILLITSAMVQEWLAGLLALGVLIPYYTILYILKNPLRKAFKILILKNNQE